VNKKAAIAIFKGEYAQFLIDKKNDIPAKQQAWTEFVDMLCKNGDIKQKQFDTWDNPSFAKAKKRG
jgi:hypothetical protein